MNQTSVRAIGGYHPITVLIINTLEKGKRGDTLYDSELQKIAGVPCGVGQPGYGYIMSAIQHCERKGIIWQRQRKENKILCLNESEVFERSQCDVRKIRRHTRRAAGRLSSIDTDSLPADKRAPALALAAQLGAIALMSETSTVKKLISANIQRPQIEDALHIFKK